MDVETCSSRSSLSRGGRRDGAPFHEGGPRLPLAGSNEPGTCGGSSGLIRPRLPITKMGELAPPSKRGCAAAARPQFLSTSGIFWSSDLFTPYPTLSWHARRANRFDSMWILHDPGYSRALLVRTFFVRADLLPIICRPLLIARGPLLHARTSEVDFFSGKNTHTDHSLHKWTVI